MQYINALLILLGNSAFQSCPSMTSVEFISGLAIIGSGMLYDVKSLRIITIPSSITSIGNIVISFLINLTCFIDPRI